MPTPLKIVAAFALTAALAAGGCTKKADDTNNTPETAEPTSTPSVQAVGDFQVVGNVDHAFVGAAPAVDVSDVDTSVEASASPGATATPDGAKPASGGVLRLSIEDLSSDLKDACNVDQGSKIDVYWTINTSFSPADIVSSTLGIEDRIEGRTAGVSGAIVRSGSGVSSLGTPTPEASAPASTDDAIFGSADCVLVADQIGLTRSATLPTPRARSTRTATPAPTPAPTATPTSTPAATTPSASTSAPSPSST